MRAPIALLLCLLLTGCLFEHMDEDRANHPEKAMGTGARIIYPGESGPSLAGNAPGSRSSSGQEQAGSGTGGKNPDAGLTLLGGSEGEGSSTKKSRQTPLIGPLTALFGYPFWIFGKSVQEKAAEEAGQQGPEGAQATAGRQHGDGAERERLRRENQEMERELRERSQNRATSGSAAVDRSLSIAEELAQLERQVADSGRAGPSPETPFGGVGEPRETVDRNADGRPDVWIYYDGARRTREVLDENHDGRVDRVLHYGNAKQVTRAEEDLDGDGRMETVSIYRDGEVIRKRADTDGDGQSDSWSFYQDGDLTRHEVDHSGDGFRDLVLVYESGELTREEEDRNDDGRPDVVVRYRGGEVAERHEDIDYDGTADVVSFYEGGKLVRRELSSEESLRDWHSERP
jgi:hypothetical protein